MLRRAICCIALAAAFACSPRQPQPQAATTTILLVRHAEKQSGGTDPDLNAAGLARANALAAVAANAHVDAVYVTQYKRTRETAQPLVDRTHVPVVQIGINIENPGDYPRRLAGAIGNAQRGKVVLVVSHSNAIPAVIKELSGIAVPPIGNDEYDRLYVVTERGVIAAQYGH